jgi:hypothetical protein
MEGAETQHSAASSALGYLYQSFFPLVELARRASADPGLVVAMELLDDVQFDQDGSPQELVQLKHHVNAQGDLSDVSVDLWRTINVWISVITELSPDEHPNLTLVTTTTAPAGSACTYLRADEHRDVSRAQRAMERAAVSSTNQTTKTWRSRFMQLAPSQREALVDAITVADGAATIDALDDLLKEALFWVLPGADRADTFITYVKGWWLGIAIKLLRRELTAFAATDMLNAIQDIRDQFGPEDLPRDLDLPEPDRVTSAGFADRVFVRQLELIAFTQDQLALAIRDYYRAFTQRSRWLRRELIGVDEIDRYEERLVDEWRFVFTNAAADLAASADEPTKQSSGRNVFIHAVETAKARIRARYDEPFMTRGTLHILADDRKVGWHPEFEARLTALLGAVVNEN